MVIRATLVTMFALRRGCLMFVLMSGCSYALVRAPRTTSPPPMDPRDVHCNDSSLIPSLDAIGGAASIAAVGGGILVEHTSDHLDHFTLYAAGPLLVLGIVYFYSGSFGTSRVERCQELKAAAAAHVPPSSDVTD